MDKMFELAFDRSLEKKSPRHIKVELASLVVQIHGYAHNNAQDPKDDPNDAANLSATGLAFPAGIHAPFAHLSQVLVRHTNGTNPQPDCQQRANASGHYAANAHAQHAAAAVRIVADKATAAARPIIVIVIAIIVVIVAATRGSALGPAFGYIFILTGAAAGRRGRLIAIRVLVPFLAVCIFGRPRRLIAMAAFAARRELRLAARAFHQFSNQIIRYPQFPAARGT
jgi:hypothetical protein